MPGLPVATPESKAVIPGGTATFTTITGTGALATSGVGLNTSATCLFTPSTTTCDADGVVTIAGEGTYTLNTSTGVVTFVADVNATQGSKTPITYRVTDITGQTATSTLTPVIPAPPVAVNDTSSGAYNTNQTISVLTNDTVTSPATLVPSTVRLCSSTSTANASCNLTTLTVAGEGTYTVNANGTVTFNPLPTFTGTASPVKYAVQDTTGQLTGATITPTVSSPAAPVATPESKAVIPGGTATFTTITGTGALATAAAGLNAAVTCLLTPSTTTCDADGVVTIAGEGTYTLNTSTGVVTFVADVNATQGSKTPITYRVTDITGQTATSTLTPVIPAPPVAVNDTSSGAYNTNQTISVLTNDTVTSPATLVPSTVRLCSSTSTANASCNLTTLTVAGEGTYTVNANGTVTFDPLSSFTGTASPVKYAVQDTTGQLTGATITPTVVPPPLPAATNDTSSGAYDTNQTISPLSNDTAGGAATLVPSTVRLCATTSTANASCNLTTLTVAGEGTYTVNTTTGVVTFDPLPSFVGTAAPVKYIVTDILGRTVAATITPLVLPPAGPAATPETKAVLAGGTATFTTVTGTGGLGSSTVGLNPSATCLFTPGTTTCDADGVVTVAGEGTYTLNASTGVVTYVADVNATLGTKTPITYKVTDIFGQTATSTLTPVIPAPPVAVNDTSSGAYDTNQVINPLANDGATTPATLVASTVRLCATTSTANTSCNLASLTVAGEGTYTVNANGTVTFDPLPTFTGIAAAVKYVVADSMGQVVSATITPTVVPPPPPSARPETKVVLPGSTISFSPVTGTAGLLTSVLAANNSATCLYTPNTTTCDADGVIQIEGEGTFTLNASTGVVTFVADVNATPGTKTSVTYKVTDILGQTVTSTLTPVIPTPPVAVKERLKIVDGVVTFSPLFGKKGLSSSDYGIVAKSACLIDPKTNRCDSDGVLSVKGLGTYRLNKKTGVVTFSVAPGAPGGNLTSVVYEVSDRNGAKVRSTLQPYQAKRAPVLPATGVNGLSLMLLLSSILIACGGVCTLRRNNSRTPANTKI